MFYLITGQDRQKSTEKVHSLIKGLLLKKPDASYFKIDSDNWNSEIIEELSSSQGLFESKYVVFADNVWSAELASEEDIEKIKSSENVFIVVENDLSADFKKKLEKSAEKFIEVADTKEAVKFNVFALSDSLGEKNSKKLWMQYQEALFSNIEAEDIQNILYWQVKNLILAKKNLLKGALKISPFVASKAKGYATRWQENELVDLAEKLVTNYHRARLGQVDMEIGLERVILEIKESIK